MQFAQFLSRSPSLRQHLNEYASRRALSREGFRQMRVAVELFERWHGKPIRLTQLTEKIVSAFLRDYGQQRSAVTVRNKRVALLALWRDAADEGLCRPPTRRIYKQQARLAPIMAWRPAEVVRLIAAARQLKRHHACGLPRSQWWELAIRVAWDSALRWGDQIALDARVIQPDGSFSVRQSKTGRVVTCRLSRATLAMLDASLSAAPRRLVTPWPASHETFNAQVRRLVAKAGIRAGTWKWLRRGSATDVERLHPGAGSAHLGHAPGSRIAEAHYFDQTILARDVFMPTELDLGGES
jgi:hypothetical protein